MVTPCILNDDDVSWWKSPELPRPHGWVSSFLWKDFNDYGLQHLMFTVVKFANSGECGGHPLFGYPAESAWSQIIFIGDALLSVRPQTRLNAWGILRYFEIFWDSTDILRCSSSCCSSCSTVQDFRSWGVRPSQAPLRLLKVLPGRWWAGVNSALMACALQCLCWDFLMFTATKCCST